MTVREKARQALKSDLDFAKLELDRTKTLFATRVVNERQLQTAQAAVTKLEIQLLQMEAEHEQAEGSLNEARAGQERLHVIDAQIEALTHQVANLAAQMHQQQVDVEDRTIKSPVPAVIDRTFMLPGEYVAAGQRILMLHNPNEVWVEANIKETQVGQLKLGQPVQRHRRRLSRREVHRQGDAHRQRHDRPLRAAADAQPVRQLHQDHPAGPGEDRHRQSAPAAQAGHDGRSRN